LNDFLKCYLVILIRCNSQYIKYCFARRISDNNVSITHMELNRSAVMVYMAYFEVPQGNIVTGGSGGIFASQAI